MSLRFDLIKRSKALPSKIEKIKYIAKDFNKNGEFLQSVDVRNIILNIREDYECGLDSTPFDKGAYAFAQRLLKKLELI